MLDGITHPSVETHGRNITPDSCVFFVAAAQSVTVEVALSQWLFKPRALHLIHVDQPNPYRETQEAQWIFSFLLNTLLNLLRLKWAGVFTMSIIEQKIIIEVSSVSIAWKKKFGLWIM